MRLANTLARGKYEHPLYGDVESGGRECMTNNFFKDTCIEIETVVLNKDARF